MTTGDKVTLTVATFVFGGFVYAMRPESDEEKRYYASQRRNPPPSLISDWWK